jgi:predicted lipid-binding transport protein (Tim44 family)
MRINRVLAALAAVVLIVPVMADARVNNGGSKGSRGSKTEQVAPPTNTAPTSKPIERTTTPTQQAQAPRAATNPAAQTGGNFFQRNPFLSGLMGGMLGAGLIGMLFGGGFGGFAGMAGMLGLLLQIALIGGLGYLAYRLIKGRTAAAPSPSPAYAGGMPQPQSQPADQPMARSMLPGMGGSGAGAAGGAAAATAALALSKEDFDTFESMLIEIQAAYSKGDLNALRPLLTPEMLSYLSEDLAANTARGVENKIDAVKLEQGDLAEAWSEGNRDYATVAMRFSMLDVTRRIADGTIVEGNANVRTEATEVWTFLRGRGGRWILSAIQQG